MSAVSGNANRQRLTWVDYLYRIYDVAGALRKLDQRHSRPSSLAGLPLYVDLWTALAWAVGAIVTAQLYMTSARGLRLRATREKYAATRAAGVVAWCD